MQQITTITPTICRLMGVKPPKLSTDEVIQTVVDVAGSILGDHPVEKCFVFAPDAIGDTLFRDNSKEF